MAKRSRSVVSTAAKAWIVAAVAPWLLLAACGQKGPLVAAKTSAAPASVPAAALAAGQRSRRAAAGLGTALMAALPGAPDIARQGGRLFVEELAVADLARRFGTPLYLYSSAAMARALAPYQRALAGRDHLICYAVKANPSLAVLQWFARQGCGFDIVSGGELERVLAAGGDPRRVVFSGVGKTRAEMRRALDADVLCFNVESVGELELLAEVAVDGRPHGADQPARQSRRRPENPSLHLDRPAREQVRHRPCRGARRVSHAPRACPDSRWSASIATSARRSSRPALTSTRSIACSTWSRRSRRRHRPRPHRPRRRPRHHLCRRDAAASRRARRRPARAHRRARPRRQEDRARARALAGRQRRHPGERGALPEARQRKELLHRRRRDERPDAAGAVRRLDGDRRMRSARRSPPAPTTSSDRSANRATGSAATARSPSSPATSSPCSRPAPTR